MLAGGHDQPSQKRCLTVKLHPHPDIRMRIQLEIIDLVVAKGP